MWPGAAGEFNRGAAQPARYQTFIMPSPAGVFHVNVASMRLIKFQQMQVGLIAIKHGSIASIHLH
jgi:hypothetical protein